MTRYALLTEFAPPDFGGIQATVGPMIEALGDEVTVIAPQVDATSNRRIVRSLFSGSTWPRWWWLVSWLRQAQRHGLRTVIFGHVSAAVFAGVVGRMFFGLRYVVFVHGNDLLTEQKRWPSKMLIGLALRQAEFIGVNSAFVEHLVRGHRVPAVHIVYTHPFIQANNVVPILKHDHNARLITVARLVPRKNISTLLQAVVEIRKKHPNTHLDIVGVGPERQNLEKQSHELGLEQSVTFHGAVDEATKWRLLQAADIFVMAPTVRDSGTDLEGLGLVYLEAAACGLPVVASDTGGVRDAVIDGQTGLLVDPNNTLALVDSIHKLLQQADLAEKFGQAGRDRVQREFTDTVRIPRLMTMLRSVPVGQEKLVSVIIPIYNAGSTIAATLTSLKKQTWKNLEIIVVDDGSTDELTRALQPYVLDITLIQQKNSGAPTARNNGFDHSAGDYVLFLDADTVLEPEAVTKMVQALTTHPAASFVYSDFYFGWKKFHLFEYSTDKLRQQNYIHTTSLIRRQSFPRFDPTLKRFQDWDLWLTMDKEGNNGLWIPEVMFRVTQRASDVGMSTWLPSFMYKLPGIGQGRGNAAIASYRQAEAVIRAKHAL